MGDLPLKPSLAYLMYASLLFQGNSLHESGARVRTVFEIVF